MHELVGPNRRREEAHTLMEEAGLTSRSASRSLLRRLTRQSANQAGPPNPAVTKSAAVPRSWHG